jgi:hypothetical protein
MRRAGPGLLCWGPTELKLRPYDRFESLTRGGAFEPFSEGRRALIAPPS